MRREEWCEDGGWIGSGLRILEMLMGLAGAGRKWVEEEEEGWWWDMERCIFGTGGGERSGAERMRSVKRKLARMRGAYKGFGWMGGVGTFSSGRHYVG